MSLLLVVDRRVAVQVPTSLRKERDGGREEGEPTTLLLVLPVLSFPVLNCSLVLVLVQRGADGVPAVGKHVLDTRTCDVRYHTLWRGTTAVDPYPSPRLPPKR